MNEWKPVLRYVGGKYHSGSRIMNEWMNAYLCFDMLMVSNHSGSRMNEWMLWRGEGTPDCTIPEINSTLNIIQNKAKILNKITVIFSSIMIINCDFVRMTN